MVGIRRRFAELIPELAKFGVVGLIGSVIDLGGAAYLHGDVGIEAMAAKALSITAATAGSGPSGTGSTRRCCARGRCSSR